MDDECTNALFLYRLCASLFTVPLLSLFFFGSKFSSAQDLVVEET